jgi:hypothetical protein
MGCASRFHDGHGQQTIKTGLGAELRPNSMIWRKIGHFRGWIAGFAVRGEPGRPQAYYASLLCMGLFSQFCVRALATPTGHAR